MKDKKYNIIRLIGLKLSGSNSKHTSISVIDYYKDKKRLFLLKIVPYLKANKFSNYDDVLINMIDDIRSEFKNIIVTNAPLSLPPCVLCRLDCKGISECKNIDVNKMLSMKLNLKKSKYISPYLKRIEDLWLEELNPGVEKNHDALSSNLAPITMRINFLQKNLKNIYDLNFFESNINYIIYEIIKYFRIPKSYLKNYKSILIGKRVRKEILEHIQKHVFIYDHDFELLVKNENLFQSFLLSICAYFKLKKTVKSFKSVIIPHNIKF